MCVCVPVLQEAHRSDLQVVTGAGLCGRQVGHVHDGEEVGVLCLEDELGLVPAAI